MKAKLFILILPFIILSHSIFGQAIPQNYFSTNAWYTWYTAYDPAVMSSMPTPALNDYFVRYIVAVKASGARFCRIGGTNANILGNDHVANGYQPITKE
jgi:hypothetical protein